MKKIEKGDHQSSHSANWPSSGQGLGFMEKGSVEP